MSNDQGARRPKPAEIPQRRGGVPDALLVGTLATLVGLALLTWSGTGIAGWLTHGEWPRGVTFLWTARAVRSLLTAPGDVPSAWPDAEPSTLSGAPMLWLVFLAQIALLFAAVLWVMIRLARWRARQTPPHQRAEAPDEPEEPVEYADPAPQPQEPQLPVFVPLPVPVPVPVVAEAPQDAAAAVLGAPEGLVVLDPDGRLWSRTARQRGKRGPIHVYDPGHATEAPVRLRWAPQRGCEDMPVARRRATALLAPVRPTEPIFRLDGEAAETLLRCYLHAAALAGVPYTQVHRWAHGRSTGEPGKILRTHTRAAGGAAMELESTLTSHPGRRDTALGLIARALSGLEQLHIRQACSPGRVDTLALDNLAGEGGTLYVVGDHKETAGLRGALVDAVSTAHSALTVIDGSVS